MRRPRGTPATPDEGATAGRAAITDADRAAVRVLWEYHQVRAELCPADAAIAFGCHDIGVAEHAAALYRSGLCRVIVFSGADNPVRAELFPRGEAVAFRDRAVACGVPVSATLVEPAATNTGANITLSRRVLDDAGIAVRTVLLVCMPYMQRRVYATCRRLWPEVEPVCASTELPYEEYVRSIGDEYLVVDHLVGDLQRLVRYPDLGYAIPQRIPAEVDTAYRQLVGAGFTRRMLAT
ncbi:MAG: YdcF family protein [Actinocatenispora sp.]